MPHRKGRLYYTAHVIIWNNFAFYITHMILTAWAFPKIYNLASNLTPKVARGLEIQFVVTAGVNVCSDIMLLFLPLFSISRLQIPAKRKTAIAAVFGTGLLWLLSHTSFLLQVVAKYLQSMRSKHYAPLLRRQNIRKR